jgi:hypothetical protein
MPLVSAFPITAAAMIAGYPSAPEYSEQKEKWY